MLARANSQRCFVFTTAPHAETRASALISDLGYRTWLPIERRIHRRPKGKPTIRENPLFPRYGFVWFSLSDDYGEILHCKGVQDLLPSRVKPIAVSDKLIEGLRLAEEIGVFDRTRPPKVGQRVELLDGAFSGMVGRIVKARAADRMRVMLKVLGGLREVEVPLMALREV